MLNFLEHENPLIRHSSKNWLYESFSMFFRILDPLLEILIMNNNAGMENENNKQFYYLKEFDTEKNS